MSRTIKTAMWSGIGLIAILVLCVIALLTFDWNQAKPWLNDRITEATGRPFGIQGNLFLTWHRPESEQSGWRKLVPWARVSAENVTIGNPPWAKAASNMAEIRRVAFSIDPLALLQHEIVIPALAIEQPNLSLQRAADGGNNWTLQSESLSSWKLTLGRLSFDQGKVRIVDSIRHADLKANIASLDETQTDKKDSRISWNLSGTLYGSVVSGKGKTGGILDLQKDTEAFPITADLTIGKTVISANGSVTWPRDFAMLDMRLKLSGANMAQLYPIIGVLLPETSAFSTEGRLTARLNQEGSEWKYEKFKGKVGASDLAGTLEYHVKKPRPHLGGELVSDALRLEDLAPLIGVDSKASKIRRGSYAYQSADKVLPVQAFRTEGWASIDADVRFIGHKIIRDQALPIDNLETDLQLRDSVLSLTPLNFDMAGGNLASTIRLDGRAKTIKAEMTVSARHLKLKQIFPKSPLMKASPGEINGDASLTATGNSIAALLGSANGEIKVLMNQGAVDKKLLKQAGLNVAGSVLTEIFGDQPVKVNCLASDFTVTDGLMESRTFVVDTEQSVLYIGGRADLVNEQLELTIDPRSRDPYIPHMVALRPPVHVKGTFKSARVDADYDAPAFRAGTRTLDALAPTATLFPLANPSGEQDSGCSNFLPDMKMGSIAPLPEQTRQAGQTGKQVFGSR